LRSFTSNARWRSHPVIFTHHKFTLKSAKVRIVYSLGEPGHKILNYIVVAHSTGNVKKQAAGHALVQPTYWLLRNLQLPHTDMKKEHQVHTLMHLRLNCTMNTVKLGQLVCIASDINSFCTMNTVKLGQLVCIVSDINSSCTINTVKLGQLVCIMSDINNSCTMNTVKLEHESRKERNRLFLSMTCTSYSTCYVPVHVSTHHMY